MGEFNKEQFARLLGFAKGNRSIDEYAKECNVSSAHISRFLRCMIDEAPSPVTIQKLASVAHNNIEHYDLMYAVGYIDNSILSYFNSKVLVDEIYKRTQK